MTSPTDADDFRSDDELARACRRGEPAAFAHLARRHESRLRAFVFGDPAWAAGGDALVRQVWAAAERGVREGKFRGGGFRAWLFKVAEVVAARQTGASSPRGVRLTVCFGRLAKASPQLHKLVMWVSHGLNRTAVAKRFGVTKTELKARYVRVLAAVRKCVAKRKGVRK
jgi:DNA-directed RNA polymerase specialized sigma24 family protein